MGTAITGERQGDMGTRTALQVKFRGGAQNKWVRGRDLALMGSPLEDGRGDELDLEGGTETEMKYGTDTAWLLP